jgi:hypothetical protein
VKTDSNGANFIQTVVNTIKTVLTDIKFGKKYENLLEVVQQNPQIKFYKIDTFSETRFANYSFKVFDAFLKDIVIIILSLENRAQMVPKTQSDKESQKEAKTILKQIANVKFIGRLAALVDIYCEFGLCCNKVQNMNLFLWEKINHMESLISKLGKMKDSTSDLLQNKKSDN